MSATADIITEAGEPGEESSKTDTVKSQVPAKKPGRSAEELSEAVFKVTENVARQIPVVTGISSDTDIEIISGLTEGDEVVSGPFRTLTMRLKDGDSVRAKKDKAGEKGGRGERSA